MHTPSSSSTVATKPRNTDGGGVNLSSEYIRNTYDTAHVASTASVLPHSTGSAGPTSKNNISSAGSTVVYSTVYNTPDESVKRIPAWVIPFASSMGFLMSLTFIVAIICVCARKKRGRKDRLKHNETGKHYKLNHYFIEVILWLVIIESIPEAESSFYDVVQGAQIKAEDVEGSDGGHNCYNVLESTVYDDVLNTTDSGINQPDTTNIETDAMYSMVGPEADDREQAAPIDEPWTGIHYEIMVSSLRYACVYTQMDKDCFYCRRYLKYTRLQSV